MFGNIEVVEAKGQSKCRQCGRHFFKGERHIHLWGFDKSERMCSDCFTTWTDKMTNDLMSTVKCGICKREFKFMDRGTVDSMPDGYILIDGVWICDDCGSCPECGRTLEKEADKRAYMIDGVLIPAKPCHYCEEEYKY